jgi:hypothetical protein
MRALLVQVSVVDGQHTVLQDQILVTGLTRDCLYQFRERLRFSGGLDSLWGWRDVEHWAVTLSVNFEKQTKIVGINWNLCLLLKWFIEPCLTHDCQSLELFIGNLEF